ncbi:MAG: hypothetical protein K1000chlam2_01397 [Chlamydiae bacterium]|nr:hypothetical protein [Chlamydiota bacterium]
MSPLVPKRLELKEVTTIERCITMTHKELERFEVSKEAHEKRLKMAQAAKNVESIQSSNYPSLH